MQSAKAMSTFVKKIIYVAIKTNIFANTRNSDIGLSFSSLWGFSIWMVE